MTDGTVTQKPKRQSLAAACKQQGIQQDSSRAHRALYDCQMALEVIRAMGCRDGE